MTRDSDHPSSELDRRLFLKFLGGGAGAAFLGLEAGCRLLEPVDARENPLYRAISRDWEQIYHDQYAYDRTFDWVCSPNDTHACRIRAYVRNGIVVRSGSTYDYQDYADLYGNHATVNWNPRQCAKGYTFHRVLYGPTVFAIPSFARVGRSGPMPAFPSSTPRAQGEVPVRSSRGGRVHQISWEEAFPTSREPRSHRHDATAARRERTACSSRATSRRWSRRWAVPAHGRSRCVAGWGSGRHRQVRHVPPATPSLSSMPRCGGSVPTRRVAAATGPTTPGTATRRPAIPGCTASRPRTAISTTCALEAHHHGRQEPGGEQDSRLPLVHRVHGARRQDRGDRARVRSALDQGRLLDSDPSPDRRRPVARHHAADDREAGSTTSLSSSASPTSRCWCATTTCGVCVPTRSSRTTSSSLDPKDGPIDDDPGLTAGAAREARRLRRLGQEDRNGPKAVTRDDVGDRMEGERGYRPALDGKFEVRARRWPRRSRSCPVDSVPDPPEGLRSGHGLRDHAGPRELIERLAEDIATIKPVAIHQGEGINHWFHATEMNRAAYLPLMLTGNIGQPGAGCHTWAGNYKAALFQGSPQTGPGFKGWVAEDPFSPQPGPENAHGKDIKVTLLQG